MTINIDPVAITIGSLDVRWYGIMISLGIALLVLWLAREIRNGAKISYEDLLTATIIAVPVAVIFSRLLHILDAWDYFSQNPGQIIGFEGLTIYGAILGAIVAIWGYSRFNQNFRFGYVMDLAAPGIVLAQSVGRVGCLINGCCHGGETTLPWGITYTHPGAEAPLGVTVHPTQLYEIAFLLVTFGVLMWLRRKVLPEGSLFTVYLSLYALWRLGIGFMWREGEAFLFGLQQAQVVSLVVLAIAVPLLIRQFQQARA